MSSNNFFINMFLHIQKCLKIHQINVIKIIKKDYKKKLVKVIKVFLKNKKKKKQQDSCEKYKNLLKDDEK